jgi:sugar phosphate permease
MRSYVDALAARKALRYRWLIFWIMSLAYMFVYFHRLSPAVVATDLQRSLDVTGGFMGILASAYLYMHTGHLTIGHT